jgi:hypothetical protein
MPIWFIYGVHQRFRSRCDHLTIRGRVDPDAMLLRGATWRHPAAGRTPFKKQSSHPLPNATPPWRLQRHRAS